MKVTNRNASFLIIVLAILLSLYVFVDSRTPTGSSFLSSDLLSSLSDTTHKNPFSLHVVLTESEQDPDQFELTMDYIISTEPFSEDIEYCAQSILVGIEGIVPFSEFSDQPDAVFLSNGTEILLDLPCESYGENFVIWSHEDRDPSGIKISIPYYRYLFPFDSESATIAIQLIVRPFNNPQGPSFALAPEIYVDKYKVFSWDVYGQSEFGIYEDRSTDFGFPQGITVLDYLDGINLASGAQLMNGDYSRLELTFARPFHFRFSFIFLTTAAVCFIAAIQFVENHRQLTELSLGLLIGILGIRGALLPINTTPQTVIQTSTMALYLLLTISIVLKIVTMRSNGSRKRKK